MNNTLTEWLRKHCFCIEGRTCENCKALTALEERDREIDTMHRKLADGTLHSSHCNGRKDVRVGHPDNMCNCTLGREIKELRHRALAAEARLATVRKEALEEAAKVADKAARMFSSVGNISFANEANNIAITIRALIPSPEEEKDSDDWDSKGAAKVFAERLAPPPSAGVVEALREAKEKLQVYYEQTEHKYGGGPLYDQLMKKIDTALSTHPAMGGDKKEFGTTHTEVRSPITD